MRFNLASMPELPEVETVRRGLAPVLEGRRLLAVKARRPDLRFPLPERFSERLAGTRVERLDRRGKYLVALLGSGEALIAHLGMSGRFTIETPENAETSGAETPGAFARARATDPAHDHVVFDVEGGGRVTFNDPRRFGFMRLAPAAHWAETPPFDAMGPEPLSDAFDGRALGAALAGKTTTLKAALLDQRVVAGLGNIYVNEALHRARLSPLRQAGTLSRARAGLLAAAIKGVLEEAIAAGGSSLRDHAQADGSLGYFQHAFDVYDRDGEACRREGCKGAVVRITQNGRSSFLCQACQR